MPFPYLTKRPPVRSNGLMSDRRDSPEFVNGYGSPAVARATTQAFVMYILDFEPYGPNEAYRNWVQRSEDHRGAVVLWMLLVEHLKADVELHFGEKVRNEVHVRPCSYLYQRLECLPNL